MLILTVFSILALIFVTWFFMGHLDRARDEIARLSLEVQLKEQQARKESVKKSKEVIRGQVTEQLVPVLPGFPYNFSDVKFFGQPFDYVIFDGMTEFRDGNKEKEINIIFADVKTGSSVYSPVQNAIKKAITSGRIKVETFKVTDNQLNIK